MSNAGRLTRDAFQKKPVGALLSDFRLTDAAIQEIRAVVSQDIEDSSYSAFISYSEALCGLSKGRTSWSVVKLYYASFYCIRCLLLLNEVISFNFKDYYLFDLYSNSFSKGGSSSHNWKWKSFRDIKRLNFWQFSEDSQEAYERLRDFREEANYRAAFKDPCFPDFFKTDNRSLSKLYTTYRDDQDFFYTYLNDHLILAYPTALINSLYESMNLRKITLSEDRKAYIKRLWPLRERCPALF